MNNDFDDFINDLGKYTYNSSTQEKKTIQKNSELTTTVQSTDVTKEKLYENFVLFKNSKNNAPNSNILNSHDYLNINNNVLNNEDSFIKNNHHEYKQDTDISSEADFNKQVPIDMKNFDEIPIKPKTNNFYELLENNLATNQEDAYGGEQEENKRPRFEYKPRPRRSDLLNIQPPTEVKKYKYYSQNYDNDFGKKSEIELELAAAESFKENELNKNKNTKNPREKFNARLNSRKNIKTINEPKETTNVNARQIAATNKIPPKVNSKNTGNKIMAEVNSTLEELENKMRAIPPKPKNNEVIKVKQKTDEVTNSQSNPRNNTNTSNSIKFNPIYDDYPSCTKNEINTAAEEEEEDHDIKMPIKATVLKTQTKLNHMNMTEQISHNKPIVKEEAENEEKEIDEEDEDEDDDNRDIIKMYEREPARVVNNNNYNYNRDEETPENTNENFYKKPEQLKILNKYFKPLINKDNNPNKPKITSQIPKEVVSDQSSLVNEKINELNVEIEKIKKENEKVSKLKSEYERLSKKLQREIEDFKFKQETEAEEFKLYKDEEMKKIEKERKVYLRNTKLLQNMPNRKDREEIDNLKEQVLKLQEEMKAKDQRNRLAMERLRKQNEEMNKKNEDLQKDIRFMEEMRLKNMNTGNNNTNSKSNSTSASASVKSSKPANNSPLNVNTVTNNQSLKIQKSNSNFNKPPTTTTKPVHVPQQKNKDYYSYNKLEEEDDKIYEEEEDSEDNIKVSNNNYNTNSYKSNSNSNTTQKNVLPKQISQNRIKTPLANVAKPELDEDDDDEIKMNVVKVTKTTGNKIEPTIKKENPTVVKKIPKKDNTSNEKFELEFLDKYHGKQIKNAKLLRQDFTDDGKIIKIYENMKKEIIFPSGVKKETFEDGYIITYFNNRDIKQLYPDGKEVYLFAENNILQFKFPDGLHVFKFQTGQLEKHFPDGTKVLHYPDGTIANVQTDGTKVLTYPDGTMTNFYPDNYQETFFPDGSLKKVDKNGVVTIDYEDGMKVFKKINLGYNLSR